MADEDVLTFEQLKNLQNKEQDSDTLQELDESFFDRVKDYLDRKKRIGGHLNNKEYRNAKHIVEDILDARQKKIIRLAFLATKSQITVDNLLPEEELLFDKVQESIKEHRSHIEEQLFGDGDDAEELGDEAPAADSPGGQQEPDDSGTDAGQDEAEEEDSGEEPEKDKTPDDGTVEQEDETDEAESDEGSEADKAADESDETPEDDEDEEDDGEELLFGSDEEENGTDDGDEETDTESQDESREGSGDEDGEELVEVRMTADVTEFMGVDLQPYGPFDEGETAEIPAENAEVLEEQGKAEQQD